MLGKEMNKKNYKIHRRYVGYGWKLLKSMSKASFGVWEEIYLRNLIFHMLPNKASS